VDSVAAFRVKLSTNDLNCVDVPLNPTHSLTPPKVNAGYIGAAFFTGLSVGQPTSSEHQWQLLYASLCGIQQPAFNGSYSFVGGQVRDVRVSSSATGIIGWAGCVMILFISD